MQHILKKFKFHDNLICEYQNWYLILREDQITFASMVLINKRFKKNVSDLSTKCFIELKKIFYDIEKNKIELMDILEGKNKISLRIIDWFVTNYSKKYNIE